MQDNMGGIIVVDYGLSLEQMLKRSTFTRVEDDITSENFPLLGNGIIKLEWKIFDDDNRFCGRDIYPDKMVDIIRREDSSCPWELGKIEHLLSIKTYIYPSVVCLGSSCKLSYVGSRTKTGKNGIYVPYTLFGDRIHLQLCKWGPFLCNTVVLGVRKIN